MRSLLTTVFAAGFIAASLFAGALTLQPVDPATNPEATAKHAAIVARTTACTSPEKTVISATAEGVVNGKRVSLPLTVIRLKEEGFYAVTRQWPANGAWAVKMVATNPEYNNYATSIVVPAAGDAASRAAAKVFFHSATEAEVDAILKPTVE